MINFTQIHNYTAEAVYLGGAHKSLPSEGHARAFPELYGLDRCGTADGVPLYEPVTGFDAVEGLPPLAEMPEGHCYIVSDQVATALVVRNDARAARCVRQVSLLLSMVLTVVKP